MNWKATLQITKTKIVVFIILELITQILILTSFFFVSKPRIYCIQAPCPEMYQTPIWQLWLIETLLSTALIIVLIYFISFLYNLFRKT
ncbi:hypothetical protein HYY69_01085 [Candidatus Woesearchaeota archaeon]|nr:hypothetical protein [Candidatus Woesearchaeota archaeon]